MGLCVSTRCSCGLEKSQCPLHSQGPVEAPVVPVVPEKPYFRSLVKTACEVTRRTGIEVIKPDRAFAPGVVRFQVEICNAQRLPIPEGSELTLIDNGYFYQSITTLPEIRPGEELVVDVVGEPKKGLESVRYLRPECSIRLMVGRETVMKQTFYLDVLDFAGGLIPVEPSPLTHTATPTLKHAHTHTGVSAAHTPHSAASGAQHTPRTHKHAHTHNGGCAAVMSSPSSSSTSSSTMACNRSTVSLTDTLPPPHPVPTHHSTTTTVSSGSLPPQPAHTRHATFSAKKQSGAKPLYNVYLVGGAGSGKTSFLRAVQSFLADEAPVQPQPSSSHPHRKPPPPTTPAITPTTELQFTDFLKVKTSPRCGALPFQIFDTWGITSDTYLNGELGPILRGEVPVGLKKGVDPSKLDLCQLDDAHLTRKEREAHAIMFFVAADKVEDMDHMTVLKSHLSVVKGLGYQPVVIMGRVDREVPEVVADPFNANLEDITRLKRRVSQRLGVAYKHVNIWVSYDALPKDRHANAHAQHDNGKVDVSQHPLGRDFNLDRLTLLNLQAGLQSAVVHVGASAKRRPTTQAPANTLSQ